MTAERVDTEMGGLPRAFPTTVWSEVIAAGDSAHPQHRRRLDHLLQAYWKPVYAFIRARWNKSVDDAKDLTQAFFVHVLEKDYVARLSEDRRSFRGYLKEALNHFLIDAERSAAVRRPRGPVVSLEAAPGVFEELGPAAPGESPEAAYDRHWFRCLMDASIETLRQVLRRDGKSLYFDTFRAYALDPQSAATYRDVGERLGIPESQVRNYLTYCRLLLRAILKERIRGYTHAEADVDRELEALLEG